MKVLVTGATGFVGTHVVNALMRRGHAVAVLARTPESARNRYNRPVEVRAGNVLEGASLAAACRDRDAVIHLVGIIHEDGEQTFDRMHRIAVENVIAAMKACGVRRLLHMSAMGASTDAASEYGRTKASGERVVKESDLDWTILRPSIIFGPGDGFFSLLSRIVRHNPGFVPIVGKGQTRFMPVSVHDVSRVFADALGMPGTIRRTFEVGGPETFTLDGLYHEVAIAVGKTHKPVIHFPLWWGKILARVFEWCARHGWIADPPLTIDQLQSLTRNNTADTSDTARVFGTEWGRLRPGLREYLHGAMRHDPRSGFGGEADLERVRVIRIR